jgi:SAM-dependent methyltransferase
MDAELLEDRIAAFSRWQYEFEFEDGIRTPVLYAGVVNRQQERRRYFFDALLGMAGGSLEGRRVLDLGCNAGYWALAAAEAGASHVLGVDARPEPVEQAQLVFEATGVDPGTYEFRTENVFAVGDIGRFDVVLCLGLLDVTARPLELFELMSATQAEILVIDTAVSRGSNASFELGAINEAANLVDRRMTFVPSAAAVERLAVEFGYEPLELAHAMPDVPGVEDYRRRRRAAFLCARGGMVATLPRGQQAQAPGWRAHLDDARERLTRLRG